MYSVLQKPDLRTNVATATPRRPPIPRRLGVPPAAVALALLAAGCASAPADPPTGPREPAPDLPSVPRVDGPLELRVSYPRDSAFVATRDTNFIFGSAGDADARVWIEDREVEVQPNGGFLAFLPVPADSVYRLRAELEGRTQTLEVPIRLPPLPPEAGDSTFIVDGSAYPAGAWVALPGERIDVGFQGTAGGVGTLILPDGTEIPLIEEPGEPGGGATDFEVSPDPGAAADAAEGAAAGPLSWYRGFFTARRLVSADTAVAWPALTGEPRPSLPDDSLFELRELEAGVPGDTAITAAGDTAVIEAPPLPTADAVLELRAYGDVVHEPLPLNLLLAEPARPRVGIAYDPDPPAENGDLAIIARPGPGGGPYHYTWSNGTELALTGERNGIYRARLAHDLDVWSPAGDIQLAAAGTPPPSSRVATVRMDPQPTHVDVHVALDRRLPYQVDEDDHSVTLTVYGAISRANFLQHGRVDPYIVRGEWSQPTNDRFVLRVHLAATPWGYETFWADDDLVLRLRRPPAIDPGAPLRGLTVGVDAGHGGADRFTMGPTGLTEADANLGIARVLGEALERRGARVILTRTSDTTLTLVERTELARQRDVDLWISVHNNAFPDGVNPWENNGTSVYYNHPRAAGLAWAVHRELLEELGLRDLGVGRADLHQARFTWAPSILSETMFMMIPQQEAALKRADVRQRIAEAHVRGLENWLRDYEDSRRRRR